MNAPREELVARLTEDLLGPAQEDEELSSRPSDRYLTGILFPQRAALGAGEDDGSLEEAGGGVATEVGSQGESIAAFDQQRPASAGLSFALLPNERGEIAGEIHVSCGRYVLTQVTEGPAAEQGKTRKKPRAVWKRIGMSISSQFGPFLPGAVVLPLAPTEIEGLEIHIRSSKAAGLALVTVTVVNRTVLPEGSSREDGELFTRFQVKLSVSASDGCLVAPRPHPGITDDPEEASLSLLFRDTPAFVTGHTCSALLRRGPDGTPTAVETSWLPQATVPMVSATGHPDLLRWLAAGNARVLSAEWLATASKDELVDGLRQFVGIYREWISARRDEISSLPSSLRQAADANMCGCTAAAERMQSCLGLLEKDPLLLHSFRLANGAMLRQRRWQTTLRRETGTELNWRPFQLGFLLCALPSVCLRDHPERSLMDLLWFPTGGGKTEAYLALIAAVLVYRRIRPEGRPDLGAGVGALMRYTLRLLTMQQFQRAAGMIMALEIVRRADPKRLGHVSFSIGLWVGSDAVANDYQSAAKALREGLPNSPRQISDCPACGRRLMWQAVPATKTIEVSCNNPKCEFGSGGSLLPIWTVDENVYSKLPSLLIGTVDKFAQIVRNPKSGRLCGLNVPHDPPDLILQDELHLISGPLGTLVGLYESAIDELCANRGSRAKILGSTATIRRAPSQVRALFDRDTFQFPPPGTHERDSFFAVTDFEAPGRLYVGLTTAGRSAKFALQAAMGSLLQSGASEGVIAGGADAYWTLTAYFNALRELGGALVLTEDDVNATITEVSRRRVETRRKLESIQELTSRISQSEIREILTNLDVRAPDGAVDVLLASNMISVGVDIPRLSLMVVNGQPKTVAEYIQATSRVGRGKVPGVIVTVYNASRARDRSHYESFATWHAALYRDVEATGVTPYAPRARDRALHAVLVAMARHLVPGMSSDPKLTVDRRRQLQSLADRFLGRLKGTDAPELEASRLQIKALLDRWERREGVVEYWNDQKPMTSLLASAEAVAARAAAGAAMSAAWGTPNSMRNVEPGTPFRMAEALKLKEEGPDAE